MARFCYYPCFKCKVRFVDRRRPSLVANARAETVLWRREGLRRARAGAFDSPTTTTDVALTATRRRPKTLIQRTSSARRAGRSPLSSTTLLALIRPTQHRQERNVSQTRQRLHVRAGRVACAGSLTPRSEYKCRFCCKTACWFCWGTSCVVVVALCAPAILTLSLFPRAHARDAAHFCDDCHKVRCRCSVGRSSLTRSQIAAKIAKLPLDQLPKCACGQCGLRAWSVARSALRVVSSAQACRCVGDLIFGVLVALARSLADCVVVVVVASQHPPNGSEFCLGCSWCRLEGAK